MGLDPLPMVQYNEGLSDYRHAVSAACRKDKGCQFEPREEFEQDVTAYGMTAWQREYWEE